MDTEAFSMEKLYRHGDRIMVSVSWVLFLITLGLAGWHDTWTEAFAIGLPSAAIPTFMLFVMPGSLLSRLTNATAFMFLSALMIHQGHGMIEMHFGIFVLLAFLLFYRDWAPIIVAAGVIAAHHMVFNYLQASGSPVYVFETRTGIDIVMVHAAYVVFESVILIYMANIFRKEAIQSEELHEIGTHLNVNNGVIDLTYRKNDARSQFSHGFNAFMEAIHTAISNAIDAAGQLSSATEQMFEITERSSRGAQQQRSETEQVATAMHEMTATVQEVARNAEQAANGARSADDEAKRGHGVVSETISVINTLAREVEHASEVIQRLESESGNIGTVLDVIRGIAEQTNLLALNAAIEAARAGEQGRGFAVVADEVRTLASRTQTSTAEIRSMIERLQSGSKEAVAVMEQGRLQASAGVSQAAKAGESLKTIAQAIATIRDMNTQIATAAEEQSCVAEEINRNITSISRVADETAGDLQQTEVSSEQLSRLSMQFTSLVGSFKV